MCVKAISVSSEAAQPIVLDSAVSHDAGIDGFQGIEIECRNPCWLEVGGAGDQVGEEAEVSPRLSRLPPSCRDYGRERCACGCRDDLLAVIDQVRWPDSKSGRSWRRCGDRIADVMLVGVSTGRWAKYRARGRRGRGRERSDGVTLQWSQCRWLLTTVSMDSGRCRGARSPRAEVRGTGGVCCPRARAFILSPPPVSIRTVIAGADQ
jgi:hypothetical protein